MPIFKSTHNILKKPDEDEVFNPNWMDSDKLVLPPNPEWDYNRALTIEDVDIWEVLYEASGGIGAYASWCPYAEFYMITSGWLPLQPGQRYNDRIVETFYGANAQAEVQIRMIQLGIPFTLTQHWVEPEHMWLYHKSESDKTILLP
jgi:hypothetical protein